MNKHITKIPWMQTCMRPSGDLRRGKLMGMVTVPTLDVTII